MGGIQPSPLPEPLHPREVEILRLIQEGLTNQEIARTLSLSLDTVKWHNQQIFAKLGVNSRTRAIEQARRYGLIDLQSAPSLREIPRPKHNLPSPLSSFICRQKELAELHSLLLADPIRLVTLTGAGGVGKTRLALQAAAGLLESFPDGVWLVDLAPLVDPARLPHAAAAALDVRESPGRPASVALCDFLRLKYLLLILDNCEHLAAACAGLAATLLQACPRLHILATSRELLSVEGETTFYVPSLSTPGAHERLDREAVSQSEAVRLFVERGQSASPGFTLSEENAAVVVQICQRLDGIPLAIELAAARLRLLSAGQIDAHLDDVFHLLTGGSRAALPRHRTLRASIDWSYDLLTPQEQGLLRTLSVFAGGWTLEAAEAVCPDGDVLDLLGQLVDKSLIHPVSGEAGMNRYRMLETIRQYSQEKLEERGEAGLGRDRHLAYCLRLAERIEPELRGRHQKARMDRLDQELNNMRAALSWALPTNLEAELRLASAMMWFWHIHARGLEGLEWLEQGLARIQAPGGPGSLCIPPVLQAKALAAAGYLHGWESNYTQAAAELGQSLGIYRELGPEGKAGAAFTLRWLGDCVIGMGGSPRGIALLRDALSLSREVKDSFETGECLLLLSNDLYVCEPGSPEVRQYLEEALALLLETGDPEGIAWAYNFMGVMAQNNNELEQANSLLEQCLPFYRQAGNREFISIVNSYLGLIAHYQGNYPAAIEYQERALAIFRDIGNPRSLGGGLINLGIFHFIEGDNVQARRCLEEALALCQKAGDQASIVFIHMQLGKLALAEGDTELAARKLADALAACRGAEVVDYPSNLLALQRGDGPMTVNLLIFQSTLAWAGGDVKGAESGLKEALKAGGEIKPWTYNPAWALDKLAQVQARRQPERAARLFGAVEHLNWSYAQLLSPAEKASRQEALGEVKAALGEPRLAELWAEGGAMTSEAAIAYAMEEAGNPPADSQ